MYCIHNFLTQYVILLNIEEKDHNKTEMGEAKTPLEATQVIHPVFSDELFRNEFFLCENRKMLKKNKFAETTVRMYCTHYITLKNSQENTCVSF